MAGKPIDIMELKQLIQLKLQGTSNRVTASLLHVDRKTVNKYVSFIKSEQLAYEALSRLSEADLIELLPIKNETDNARYEQLAALFDDFYNEYKKPGCTLQGLWNQYRLIYPEGYSYTQFTVHFNAWREKHQVSGKLVHPAGKQVMVDFCGKKLHYIDRQTGEEIEVEVFVGILPCSQLTFAKAVPSQKRDDFIDVMGACLEYFGGVPHIVSDNLKSAVSKVHKYEPVINKTFKDFALHYATVIDPARPYSPKDKALVEGAVKLVYQRIFYPLNKMTFFSLSELNKAISEQLERYNDYLFQRKNTSRRKQFIDIEKAHLKSLPTTPYQVKTYKRAKVQKMGFVYVSEDKNYYSVPYRYIGKHVEVQYSQNSVEIFYNHTRIASHPRSLKMGAYTLIKDHLSSAHRAFSEWSLDYFVAKAKCIGPATAMYITQLIEQYSYPEQGYRQAMGICHLTRTYHKERIEQACNRALAGSRYRYHIIENILKKGLDQQVIQFEDTKHIKPHDNIRGANNYH